ncbi:hypothetical protein J8273_5789 [Carpediemonas membranifera]|uniref:Uncharacterized protein n=1 Tax=Carpediemonas membranifera TaxID=201153 RepID=A0A8J6BWX4_9EUKA|nr:hypothetical protein J8273_5789 [Carpediemonas membranifera]|eukprot:KAG9392856.1 hypothetical protein J8273_5789 [Carpediemonas membranifera]
MPSRRVDDSAADVYKPRVVTKPGEEPEIPEEKDTVHEANPFFGFFQLAGQMRNMDSSRNDLSSDDYRRYKSRAEKWMHTIYGMLTGDIAVGSRAPIKDTPTWVTLEVLRGGFASGDFVAGGPLLQWESDLAVQHHVEPHRADLNRFFLTGQGMKIILDMLVTGKYRVSVPEEAAIPVLVWYASSTTPDWSSITKLAAAIAPFFDRLRFYPEPTSTAFSPSEMTSLMTVPELIEMFNTTKGRASIQANSDALNFWRPAYIDLLTLLTELTDHRGLMTSVSLPTAGWVNKARVLFNKIRAFCPHRADYPRKMRRGNFGKLFDFMVKLITRKPVTQLDKDMASHWLKESTAKYGLATDARGKARLEMYALIAQSMGNPKEYAHLVARRLTKAKVAEIFDPTSFTRPVTKREATPSMPMGRPIPMSVAVKVERGVTDTINGLIGRGVLTSAEMVAAIMPKVTSGVQAAVYKDETLRALMTQTMRAFSSRRSLLLLNLESQVTIDELPWVNAVARFRVRDRTTAQFNMARDMLVAVLMGWPYQILPNKFLSELGRLMAAAQVKATLSMELAADIFCEHFSTSMVTAVQEALARYTPDNLYAVYYNIREFACDVKTGADVFELCCKRSGQSRETRRQAGYSVANNGALLEQYQVLTAHNLAKLWDVFSLDHVFTTEQMSDMGMRIVHFMAKEIANHEDEKCYHALLLTRKNICYAWRQFVFIMSRLQHDEVVAVLDDLTAELGDKIPPSIIQGFEDLRGALDAMPPANPQYGWIASKKKRYQ